MTHRVRDFVTRYEMPWHIATVLTYVGAVALVFLVFPDVSNLWVSILVLVAGFTSSVTAMIGVLKTKGTDE